HLDGIAEAAGDQQSRARALALDNGVGRERRAVDDEAEIARRRSGIREQEVDAGEHPFLGSRRCREHLAAEAPAIAFEREIRECAADVDGETRRAHPVATSLILPPR